MPRNHGRILYARAILHELEEAYNRDREQKTRDAVEMPGEVGRKAQREDPRIQRGKRRKDGRNANGAAGWNHARQPCGGQEVRDKGIPPGAEKQLSENSRRSILRLCEVALPQRCVIMQMRPHKPRPEMPCGDKRRANRKMANRNSGGAGYGDIARQNRRVQSAFVLHEASKRKNKPPCAISSPNGCPASNQKYKHKRLHAVESKCKYGCNGQRSAEDTRMSHGNPLAFFPYECADAGLHSPLRLENAQSHIESSCQALSLALCPLSS